MRTHVVLLLLIVPFLAGGGLFVILNDGTLAPGVTPDSIAYIESAGNFAMGLGITQGKPPSLVPMTLWAPLYPVWLGSGIMLGHTAEATAAATNPFLLAVFLFFLGAVIARLTESVAAAVAGQALAAVSLEVFSRFAYVLSEPLFLALMLIALYAIVEYQSSGRFVWLVLAAILLGLCVMTRYAGMGVVAGATLYVLWQARRRWLAALVVLTAAVVPFAVWAVIHGSRARPMVGRSVELATPRMSILKGGLTEFGRFAIPHSWLDGPGCWIGMAALLALAAGIVWRKTRLAGVIGTAYVGIVLLSLTATDRGMRVDARILLPAMIALLIVVLTAVVEAVRRLRRKSVKAVAVCLAVLFFAASMMSRASYFRTILNHVVVSGLGFESRTYANSTTIRFVRTLPPDVLIVCTRPDAIRYLTGHAGTSVPARLTSRNDPQLQRLARQVREQPCALMECMYFMKRPATVDARELKQWFDVELLRDMDDGAVYWIREKTDPVTGVRP